jgi:gamma-glutamylcyclotransferase (GGCT)/AIG2-like uncharacterized protein YtfP
VSVASHGLFVYGTLKSEAPQGALVGPGRRQPARVRGTLWSLPAGYPALQLAGDGWVEGELVGDPGPARLALLDRYEGVDEGLYQRVLIEVVCSLQAVRAWAYVMDDPALRGGVPVTGGRWRPTRRR